MAQYPLPVLAFEKMGQVDLIKLLRQFQPPDRNIPETELKPGTSAEDKSKDGEHAGPAPQFEGLTEADRRHFDFVQTLMRISELLTADETSEMKLFCSHLIPQGQLRKIVRPIDIFQKLVELGKINQENLDFVVEILERMGRPDLVRNVLLPFQPPDREILEAGPEPQPAAGTSAEDKSVLQDGDAYTVIQGQQGMIQETVDQYRHSLSLLCGTRRSQVKFRGYKKRK